MDTVIYFKYGGSYVRDADGIRWIDKESRVYAITLCTTSLKDITYSMLEDAVVMKIGVDRSTTQLKLSFFPYLMEGKWESYIFDDGDVSVYLGNKKDGCRSLLYVEALNREVGSSVGKNYEEMESNVIGVKPLDVEKLFGLDESIPNADVDEDEDDDDWYGEGEDWDDSEDSTEDEDDCEVEREDGSAGGKELIEIREAPFDGNEHQNGNEHQYGNEYQYGNEHQNGNEHENVREWDDGTGLELYDEFATKQEVQDIITKASHRKCYEFRLCNSDSWRYVVKCRGLGCIWYVRVVRVGKVGNWKIRTYRGNHTCSPIETSTTTKRRKGTVRLVANVVNHYYPGSLDTPSAKSIIGLVQNKVGVEVSYATALRGKKAAANCVRGNVVESYKSLPSYLYMVEKLNPGSVTNYKLDHKGRFKYSFVALGACIEGFSAMRKVLSVDACHLKTVREGVLVFASAQDGDRHHYPIAFAILDGEKDASWNWFFTQMVSIVRDDPELVWISDRNAGLIKGIAQLYPRAKHGYCMYHLSQNVKGKVFNLKKGPCAEKFRELAQLYTEADFIRSYADFGIAYPEGVKYLEEKVVEGPKKWARCYFPGERYNINTTNTSESLNNVFRKARKYSLLLMMDTIVQKIAEWFNRHRKESAGINDRKVVPSLEKELSKRCNIATTLRVDELNSFLLEYHVTGKDGKGYLVDLNNKSCTCRCFDIDKYPCVHAIAALMAYMKTEGRAKDIHMHELCSRYYQMDTWALGYYRTIYPVPHESQWHGIPVHITQIKPLPPKYRPKKGRVQETRFPVAGEKQTRPRKRPVPANTVDPDVTENTGNIDYLGLCPNNL